MRVEGVLTRSIVEADDGRALRVLDQTRLPGRIEWVRLESLEDAARAIREMVVRGAPLIGVTAAYGLALGLRADSGDAGLERARKTLLATRPTAVNLRWAVDRVAAVVRPRPDAERAEAAWREAGRMAEEDVAVCAAIGSHGARLLSAQPGRSGRLELLTHCNAGWLATVDWGTALAPVYALHDAGVPVHVWVSETRPRNQGMLTAWELRQHGVPHTLIVDNAAGHLLQRESIDACITGADRVTSQGDVCNKIGTYLKALAAREAGVPFYAAVPSSTIDWTTSEGSAIPIEQRAATEIDQTGELPVFNPGFDVTPARLVTALVTERGVCDATPAGLAGLFPERAA
ncbi:MAG TPA: S-methyl-5-thioribose-1-phosphate isomerase [Gemmatimonadales bacterium]|nr:S-methyl-5-thioribose-1-phosphate isomerase [Gemmatimonadales bacterium]